MKYILTYGIACIKEKDNKQELVAQISDITTDRRKIETLIESLNKNQLSPEHLADIVDDMLATI